MTIYEFPFWLAEVLFAAAWIAVRAVFCICRKKIDRKREAMLLLMYINLAVLLRFVFFPFETVNGHVQPLQFIPSKVLPLRVNLIPFVHILQFDSLHDLKLNIIGNVTMFIPTGIVLPVLYQKLNSFLKVTAAGALLSLCIELLQLPFSVRASDIDDLLLNTFGCMAGYAIYACIRRIAKKNRKADQLSAQNPRHTDKMD